MTLEELLRATIQAARAEGIPIEGLPPASAASDSDVLSGLLGLDDGRVAKLETELAQMREVQRRATATAWADATIRDRRALPRDRNALIGLHLQAAEDDLARPLQTGSRVAQVEQSYSQRLPHVLTAETVGAQPLLALAGQVGQVDEAAYCRKLLSMTGTGRKALAMKGEN